MQGDAYLDMLDSNPLTVTGCGLQDSVQLPYKGFNYGLW